jgi:hypothetical protein
LDFSLAKHALVDLQISKLAIEGPVRTGGEPKRGLTVEVPPGGIETDALGHLPAIDMQREADGRLYRGDVMPAGGQRVIPGHLPAMPRGPDFAGRQRGAENLSRVLSHGPSTAILYIRREIETLPE